MIAHTPSRLFLLLALACTGARAQTADPAIPPTVAPRVHHHSSGRPSVPAGPNLDLILLDPAHGGEDTGARLGPNLLEKDVDLAFAIRLRAVLASRGFTVVLTRDNDPAPQAPAPNPDPAQPAVPAPVPAQLTADSRAELANRTHPLACLLLHATEAGRGVHLYTSALAPVSTPNGSAQLPPDQRPIQLWDAAQAAFLPQSQRLAADLSQSLRNLSLPLISAAASVSPVDSMACAAVAIELAPTQSNGGSLTQPADAAYQASLANSILEALLLWRSQSAAAQPAPPQSVPAAKPKPRTRPKPPVAAKPNAPTTEPTGAAQ